MRILYILLVLLCLAQQAFAGVKLRQCIPTIWIRVLRM